LRPSLYEIENQAAILECPQSDNSQKGHRLFRAVRANQPKGPALANPRIVDRDAEQRDHGNDHPQVHAWIISESLGEL
jgi:hypothetical protein